MDTDSVQFGKVLSDVQDLWKRGFLAIGLPRTSGDTAALPSVLSSTTTNAVPSNYIVHTLGELNVAPLQDSLQAKLKQMKAILNEHKQLCITKGQQNATRLYTKLLKNQSQIDSTVSAVRGLLESCETALKNAISLRNLAGVGQSTSIPALQVIAKDIGFHVFVEVQRKKTTVTLSGVMVLIDVSYNHAGEVEKVDVGTPIIPEEHRPSQLRVNEILLRILSSGSIESLRRNLSIFMSLDRACSQADVTRLLTCFETDLTILLQRETNNGASAFDQLSRGHGILLPSCLDCVMPTLVFFASPTALLKTGQTETSLTDKTFFEISHLLGVQRGFLSIELNNEGMVTLDLSQTILDESDTMSDAKVPSSWSPLLRSTPRFATPPITADHKPVQYVLHLTPPVPMSTLTASKLESQGRQSVDAARRKISTKVLGISLQELLLRESQTTNSAVHLLSSQQFVVNLPGSASSQVFFVGERTTNGVIIERVPFSHPSQLYSMILILRQQLIFNELFCSCFHGAKPQSKDKLSESQVILEVTSLPPTSLSVTIATPHVESLLCIEVTIEPDCTIIVSCHPPQILQQLQPAIQQIISRSLSIPLAVHIILKRLPTISVTSLPLPKQHVIRISAKTSLIKEQPTILERPAEQQEPPEVEMETTTAPSVRQNRSSTKPTRKSKRTRED